MKHPARKSIGFQLMLAARLYRTRMALLLDDLGLFPGQEQTLQVLAAGDGATMGDLSRVLRVRPPTISKTIARLTAQGLVERRISSEDARVVRVHLTEAGFERLARLDAVVDAIEAELAEMLDDKEGRRLRKMLRRITKGLNRIVDPEGIEITETATLDEDGDLALPDEE